MVDAYGPFDEPEADAFAARLRKDYGLKAAAVRLQPWTGRTSYQRMEDAARESWEGVEPGELPSGGGGE